MIGLPDLHWFPKPFGAGDTDGTGAQRVLGQPDLDLHTLLVRETAQNSWDAALPGQVPLFQLRHRVLDAQTRDVLRWKVLRESSPDLGLDEALQATTLTAAEIVDRRTKGLGGPTRNDIELSPGSVSDFPAFVLTIGAPPDHQQGGGTYGFGKTASYSASQCSTVIIWSRSWDKETQTYIERFIASAMGPSFSIDAQRYTGRQWWGLPSECDRGGSFRFEPVTGNDARRLGEAVFERHFHEHETGTSLLILQPHPAEEGQDLAEVWIRALTDNLWPKNTLHQAEDRRMQIEVWAGGQQLTLPAMENSPVWQGKQACLEAIRAVQAGEQNMNPLVRVETIESYRPKALLGHLGLMHVPHDPNDEMRHTADTVTYMRSRAELVVKAEQFGASAVDGYRWVGVFKPVAAHDPAFAMSEPPAHDNWNPEGVQDKRIKSVVTVALTRIREKVRDFLTPAAVPTSADEAASTGAVSAALSGLTGSGEGSRAVPKAKRPGRASQPRTQRVEILDVRLLALDDEDVRTDRQRTLVALTVRGTAGTVHPSRLAIAVDGGSLASEDQVALEGWQHENGSFSDADEVFLEADEAVGAIISYPQGIAINFSFGVRAL